MSKPAATLGLPHFAGNERAVSEYGNTVWSIVMWITDDVISQLLGVESERDEYFRSMVPDRANNAMRLRVMNEWLAEQKIELKVTGVQEAGDCLEWYVECI